MPFSVSHYHLVKSLKEKKERKRHSKSIAKPLVYYAPKNGNNTNQISNTKHNTKDVKIHTKTLIGIA